MNYNKIEDLFITTVNPNTKILGLNDHYYKDLEKRLWNNNYNSTFEGEWGDYEYLAEHPKIKDILESFSLRNICESADDEDDGGFIISFNRLHPSYCELCHRTHDKDNTLYIRGNQKQLRLCCRRTGKSKVFKISC